MVVPGLGDGPAPRGASAGAIDGMLCDEDAAGAGLDDTGLSARGRGGAAAALAFFSFSSPGLTGDGRDSRPRRWALPITALRLTPPSSSAIWLAVEPSVHIVLRRSIRSSVQLIVLSKLRLRPRAAPDRRFCRERPDVRLGPGRTRNADASRRQLGRPQDPLYQGGAAVLQGPAADRVGAGHHDPALFDHLHRRAGPPGAIGDGRAVRRFHRARPDHHGDAPERVRQLVLLI